MRIAIIADQHGSLPTIPECDLLIVSGDLTGGNPLGPRDDSDERWLSWLRNEWAAWASKGAPFTIAVGGNHDTCLEQCSNATIQFNRQAIKILCEDWFEFRSLRIWGAPWVKKWDALAFNLPEPELEKKWSMIPADTDILVCHGPPFGRGDYVPNCGPQGSPSLRQAIEIIQPKLVTCGHLHEGRGEYRLGNTRIINAACGFVEIDL
jgi:Icc-related predicted phosphoesterase